VTVGGISLPFNAGYVPPSETSSWDVGSIAVTPGLGGFGSSSPTDGVPHLAMLPPPEGQDYFGTLTSANPTMTIQIPDGVPGLIMSVHSMGGEPGGETPAMEQFNLVEKSGTPEEQVDPNLGPGSMPPQIVGVLFHNAPTGGHLLVQIGAADSSFEPESGTTTAQNQPANWNLSFVLNVQEPQAQVVNSNVVPLASSSTAIGTLIVAPGQQSGPLLTTSAESAAATVDSGQSLDNLVTTTAVAPVSAAPDLASESSLSFDDRVPTGPLASRSAGPLGPTLASLDFDPTQPVDRHERALSQEIDRLGVDLAAETTTARSDSSGEGATTFPGSLERSTESLRPGEPVIAVSGRGGFPLKVTAQGRGQPVELAALWATLPTAANLQGPAPSVAEARIAAPDVPLAPAADNRASADPRECPDYVKAACGLALGLGLTSGPLFSDLIASPGRRVPTWFVALRARVGRAGPSSLRRIRISNMSAWLRRLVVRA
jgi:hypothetical protein